MVHVMNPKKKRPRNFSNGHVATRARRWSTWQTNSDERRSRTASKLSHQLTTLVRGKIMEEIVTIQTIKATCAQVVECERSCSESWLVGWSVGRSVGWLVGCCCHMMHQISHQTLISCDNHDDQYTMTSKQS